MADIVLGPGQNIWLYYDPARGAWTSFITGHTSGGLSGGLSASANESITGAWTFSGGATINGGLTLGTDLTVVNGGTGASTFTSNGVLYGNGTGAILATAQGAANSVLTANAGAPSFSATPTVASLTTTGDLTVGDQLIVSGVGPHVIGGSAVNRFQVFIDGTFTAGSGGQAGGLVLGSTIVGTAGNDISGMNFGANFTEASSGNHPLIAALKVQAGAVNAGGATVTNTASLYIDNAMSAIVTGANYALWVDAGTSRFDGDGTDRKSVV